MRERLGHPARGLAPENRAPVRLAAEIARGQRPRKRNRRTERDAHPAASRYQRIGAARSAGAHHGATTATGSTCSRITGPFASTPRPIPAASQRIPVRFSPRAARRTPIIAAIVHSSSSRSNISSVTNAANSSVPNSVQTAWSAGSRSSGQSRCASRADQRQRSQRAQRRDQARPPVVDAEQRPADVDQPEQQRRLVAVGLAVDVGHEEIAAQPHLPGDARVARLVYRPQRSQPHRRNGEHGPAARNTSEPAIARDPLHQPRCTPLESACSSSASSTRRRASSRGGTCDTARCRSRQRPGRTATAMPMRQTAPTSTPLPASANTSVCGT